ncbi:MAG: class I SAM-dependent methyltransferase family protein [Candidatus Lokiarchaeota archaeon]|nr:class I SAM-dependent methyltransferase family protein [Candidatus Lokiarchaeota archaeon]
MSPGPPFNFNYSGVFLSYFLRIERKNGQIIHKFLTGLQLLEFELQIQTFGKYLFFPLKRQLNKNEIKLLINLNIPYKIEEKSSKKAKINRINSLKDEFKKVLNQKEIDLIPHSFDVLGHVLIIDFPVELQEKKKLITKILIEQLKPVKSVVQKLGPVTGELRVREYELLEGDKDLETIYTENNCKYKLDISKVFFNPRLSSERMRIAELIDINDNVLDMFAGVGPFTCLIAKKAKARITAIDLNPYAIFYLQYNIKLNKVEHLVNVIEGDIRNVLKDRFHFAFDKVIMNLPEKSYEFLDIACKSIKKEGGIIYFYAFINENDSNDEFLNKIKNIISNSFRNLKKINIHKVRLVAPYEWQVCYELSIK